MNQELLRQLRDIVGEKSVLTQPGDLYLYSFDSALDRSIPGAVVLPGTPDQVAQVVRVLSKARQTFVARGAATSLCGGPVPLHGAVVIGLARLNRVVRFDKEKKEIIVEPGVVNQKLQQLVAKEGLFYPPDPGSQKACTIGGNVATNAGGPHCLKYGVTSQFVTGLDVVFPDGAQAQYRIDDPGYDVVGFLVGSEGTLALVTRIRLKLLSQPTCVRTMLVSFASIEEAIQSVTDIIASGLLPATLEAMDKTTVAAVEAFVHAGYPLDAEAVLLIEVDGNRASELDEQVKRIEEICAQNKSMAFRFATTEQERQKLWEGRRGSYAAMARLAPNVLVEDGAVPRTKLPEALKRIKEIAEESKLKVALLFHAGDGNLHPQIIFDERNREQTQIVKAAGYKMLKACVDLGGTISGEHGVGIDKREAMKWLFNRETLTLFRRLKNIFDPENYCNPDKLLPLVSKAAAKDEPLPEFPSTSVENVVSPKTEAELVSSVRALSGTKTMFGIRGRGTKYNVRENVLIETSRFDQIVELDKGNLTLIVQGGADLAAVKAQVESQDRYLWLSGTGSIGGVIATKQSAVPAIRDLILGMKILLPTGELVQVGARTMKNVAGYDVAKLLIGSWGTLGIIVDVTFRLFAFPPRESRMEPTVRPFVFRDVHHKIKKAFDPQGLLGNRMVALSEKDIGQKPKGDEKKPEEEDKFKGMVDKFWM